jgi:DNA-binding transcriptional regulator YdaS (Cro superfamily)
MNPITALQIEFGVLSDLAQKLGIRESAVYAWKARNTIPKKHIRSIEKLSEGRLTREMLRPDLFKE